MPVFRLFTCSLLAAVAVVAVGGCSLARPAYLYPGERPALQTSMDRSVTLTAVEGRAVPLKIVYPVAGGPYPLIVLSHGTFSNIDRYDRIAGYWAGQGYVVILPQHKDANYGVRPTGYAMMQAVAMTRVADMSLVLDELPAIESQVPALARKIDHGHYVVAGHSMGTQVAMLLTGMQFKTPFDGKRMQDAEDRFEALILISDPGKMRLMPADLWLASNVPTLMATGTDDYGLMGRRGAPAEAQSEVVFSNAVVDRYRLLLDGGDHYFGGLIQKDVDGTPDHEGLAIFNAVSTAFLDAYIKGSVRAHQWLERAELQKITRQRASLEKRP